MSDSAHLPIEGVIGIVVGGVAILVVIATVLFCRLYKRTSVKLEYKQPSVVGAWIRRRGDAYDPSGFLNSGSSFDTKPWEARGRLVSYDRPYVHKEDKAVEADLRRSLHSREIVSNYGEVKMMSFGDKYPHHGASQPYPHSGASQPDPHPGASQPDPHRDSGYHAPQNGFDSNQLLESTDSKTQLLQEEPLNQRSSIIRTSGCGYKVAKQQQVHTPPSAYPADDPFNDYPYATVDKRPVSRGHSSSVYRVQLRASAGRPRIYHVPSYTTSGNSFRVSAGEQLRTSATKPRVYHVPSYTRNSKHDSFRASAGVDLGAEPRRAWDTSQYRDPTGRRNPDFVTS